MPALGQLVDDPAVRSGALVVGGGPAPGASASVAAPPVRVAQKRIVSAGSSVHEVSGAHGAVLGALVIDGRDRPSAAAVLAAAVDVGGDAGWEADPIDLALVGLVRAQVACVRGGGPWDRCSGGRPSQRERRSRRSSPVIDEARVLLERANRPDDGFYSTFVLRRASKPVTALALRLGLTPNQISLVSLVVGLAAAASLRQSARGGPGRRRPAHAGLAGHRLRRRRGRAVHEVVLRGSVHGSTRRATGSRSTPPTPVWPLGSARSGRDIWLLATLVMIMQTVRHVGRLRLLPRPAGPGVLGPGPAAADPSDGGAAGSGATLELSAQMNRDSRVRWGKKVLRMPIGERWLVLSRGRDHDRAPMDAACSCSFLGLVALAYTTAGRDPSLAHVAPAAGAEWRPWLLRAAA